MIFLSGGPNEGLKTGQVGGSEGVVYLEKGWGAVRVIFEVGGGLTEGLKNWICWRVVYLEKSGGRLPCPHTPVSLLGIQQSSVKCC